MHTRRGTSSPPLTGCLLAAWAAGPLGCAPEPAAELPTFPAGVNAGAAQVCSAPLDTPAWEEVGETLGLRGEEDPEGDHTIGGTVVVEDLDDDGLLDLFLGHKDVQRLYLGTGEGFREAETTSLARPVDLGTLSLGDVDGDGLLDVIAAELHPWFGRVREGRLERTELVLGAPWDGQQSTDTEPILLLKALLPADLDGDGHLDLFQLLPDMISRTDRMLHGRGQLTWEWFEEESSATGLRNGFDAVWFDWDRDADLDLYVVQDMGAEAGGNQLFENRDGWLVDRSADCACDLAVQGMGGAAADFNHDGWADLYVAATSQNLLLAGSASGAFVDVTQATRANPIDAYWRMGWGAIFADLDNDGWLDIVSATGDLWPSHNPDSPVEPRPSAVLLQREGLFEDHTVALGMDRVGSWRGVVAHDLNEDGVLDLLITDTVQRPSLYLSTGCTRQGWLEVSGPQGTRVEVTADGVTQTAWIETQSSSTASHPLSAHFGLGEAETVDALVVTLPGGEERRTPRTFSGRRRIRVTENP